jgi:hypothetical protein
MELLQGRILPGDLSANLYDFDHGRIDALPNIDPRFGIPVKVNVYSGRKPNGVPERR